MALGSPPARISLVDDDGLFVVSLASRVRPIAEFRVPDTLLDLAARGEAIAIETGTEGTWIVEVATGAPKVKKSALRGPFVLRVEDHDDLTALSWGAFTRGEVDAQPLVRLAPGSWAIHFSQPASDHYVIHVEPTTKQPRRPAAIASFAPMNPFDVHPTAVMLFGLAAQALASRDVTMRPKEPDRVKAREFALMARRQYAELGRRGAKAVAEIDLFLLKNGLDQA